MGAWEAMKTVKKKYAPAPERGITYVGTAGWAIPAQYKVVLPGTLSHLERYAQRLAAVEINSSFHRHHQRQTYRRWSFSVPANFRFSVKVPRTLTHSGELSPDARVLDCFIDEIQGLGDKLGVILVQFPPKLMFEERISREFFEALRKRAPTSQLGFRTRRSFACQMASFPRRCRSRPVARRGSAGWVEQAGLFPFARAAAYVLFRLQRGASRILA
jgi:uncharacterized protein YecE (DUF72 family)